MNARGTRRPHARRPYKRDRKASRSKTPGKGWGCVLVVFAFLTLPAFVLVVTVR